MPENNTNIDLSKSSFLESIYSGARKICPTIILADAEDARAIHAARRIEDLGIAKIILLGSKKNIQKIMQEENITLKAEIFDRAHDKSKNDPGSDVFDNPTYAAKLVSQKYADCFISGNLSTTKETILAAKKILPADGFKFSYFIMIHDNKPMIFADCAYHIEPDSQALALIGVEAAHCAKELGISPNIAFLSFSTYGSAEHMHVDKVRTATIIAKKMAPQYNIEGELQFDAAWNPEISEMKSTKASKRIANVFVFPDLNSGNIAYKVAVHMGGCVAIGPILQGFSSPASDLSRGCTADDIVNAAAAIALQVKR